MPGPTRGNVWLSTALAGKVGLSHLQAQEPWFSAGDDVFPPPGSTGQCLGMSFLPPLVLLALVKYRPKVMLWSLRDLIKDRNHPSLAWVFHRENHHQKYVCVCFGFVEIGSHVSQAGLNSCPPVSNPLSAGIIGFSKFCVLPLLYYPFIAWLVNSVFL